MGQSKHDKIAHNLAKEFNAEYNEGKGPDIKAKNKVVVTLYTKRGYNNGFNFTFV